MNKQSDRAIFVAINGIDDDLIEEANQCGVILFTRIVKVAAVAVATTGLAVLMFMIYLTADSQKYAVTPSVLAVSSYSVQENQSLMEVNLSESTVDFPFSFYYEASSILPGLPLTLELPSDIPCSLTISVSNGYFTDECYDIDSDGVFWPRENNGKLGKKFTLTKNRTIYWNPLARQPGTNELVPLRFITEKDVYVDIILYSNDHIIGYCSIKIFLLSEKDAYSATIVDSAFYPQVDGKYQNVTEAYINKQFLKSKLFG